MTVAAPAAQLRFQQSVYARIKLLYDRLVAGLVGLQLRQGLAGGIGLLPGVLHFRGCHGGGGAPAQVLPTNLPGGIPVTAI